LIQFELTSRDGKPVMLVASQTLAWRERQVQPFLWKGESGTGGFWVSADYDQKSKVLRLTCKRFDYSVETIKQRLTDMMESIVSRVERIDQLHDDMVLMKKMYGLTKQPPVLTDDEQRMLKAMVAERRQEIAAEVHEQMRPEFAPTVVGLSVGYTDKVTIREEEPAKKRRFWQWRRTR
jgi:hypothetical protein